MKSALPAVVVGGGIAGLSAATALAEAGVAVRLFEARPTLGGRANTFRDPVTGDRVDNGQHVLAGCYSETLRFLRRIGAVELLHWPSTLRVPVIDEDGRRSELVLPPLPAPIDLAAGVLTWDALCREDRWSVLRIAGALKGRARIPPDETVRDLLKRYQQSSRLCRLLWEPLALATLNQSIDQAAATSFVAVTSRMFGGAPGASTLLLPAVPLDELYVAPARRFLNRHGVEITTNAKVALAWRDGSLVGIEWSGQVVPATLIVCAVPWFAVSDLLEGAPDTLSTLRDNADAMPSSPIITVNLWFEGYVADDAFVGLPGRTFQWAFARERLVGSGQSHLSLVSSGADAICSRPNDALIALAVAEVREAIPAIRGRSLTHALVIRERRATFSLRPGTPPRPATTTSVGGLLLAGDWIDTGLPATIESAVLSGHMAAAAALTRCH